MDNFGNSLNDIFQVTMVSPILYFNDILCTWFSGELGREAQDEFEEEGEGGSSLTQTPVEGQHSWHLHVVSGCAYQMRTYKESWINNPKLCKKRMM